MIKKGTYNSTDIKSYLQDTKEVCEMLVECPKCHQKQRIQFETQMIKEASNLTSIYVPPNKICNHCFIIFVDKFYSVRGYQFVDYIIS